MTPYWISRNLLFIFLKIFFGLKVRAKENFPSQGGYIIAANHVSYLDPPVAGAACSRHVRFMAKQQLFSIPVLGSWMRAVGTIPVRRGFADRRALKNSVEILNNGGVVCVFPEGTRVAPGTQKPAEKGVIFLANMARVPIIPLAIHGTQPCFTKIFGFIPWFSRVEARVGKPIYVEFHETSKNRDEMFNDALNLLMSRIKELLRDANPSA